MANGKDKTYFEVEIRRVKSALKRTESASLKRDYGKYLKKLYRERGKLLYGNIETV